MISSQTFYIAIMLGLLQIPAWSLFHPNSATAASPSSTAETNTTPGPSDFNVFAKLAKQAVPSVVNLSSTSMIKTSTSQGFEENDLFSQFLNQYGQLGAGPAHRGQGRGRKEVALGTGFIIDASGLLLTNNHVVANAEQVEIQLTENTDEKPIIGKVVGRDPDLDVAIVRFDPPRKLTALTLGNSDDLAVGEFVMAVGNPYGQGHSVSHGIISAKGRTSPDSALASFANYLQTDAPINPGNSGGPLLNLRGEVVGINNAIDPRAQGISFAIPINFVKAVLPDLESKGKVSRGFIGAAVATLTADQAEKMGESRNLLAPWISDVVLGGPAAKAGIRPNDIITEARGKPVHSAAELIQSVTATTVGKELPLTILRNGKKLQLDVRVSQRPSVAEPQG